MQAKHLCVFIHIWIKGEVGEKASFENVNIALLIVYAWYNNLLAISISIIDSQTSLVYNYYKKAPLGHVVYQIRATILALAA